MWSASSSYKTYFTHKVLKSYILMNMTMTLMMVIITILNLSKKENGKKEEDTKWYISNFYILGHL